MVVICGRFFGLEMVSFDQSGAINVCTVFTIYSTTTGLSQDRRIAVGIVCFVPFQTLGHVIEGRFCKPIL